MATEAPAPTSPKTQERKVAVLALSQPKARISLKTKIRHLPRPRRMHQEETEVVERVEKVKETPPLLHRPQEAGINRKEAAVVKTKRAIEMALAVGVQVQALRRKERINHRALVEAIQEAGANLAKVTRVESKVTVPANQRAIKMALTRSEKAKEVKMSLLGQKNPRKKQTTKTQTITAMIIREVVGVPADAIVMGGAIVETINVGANKICKE